MLYSRKQNVLNSMNNSIAHNGNGTSTNNSSSQTTTIKNKNINSNGNNGNNNKESINLNRTTSHSGQREKQIKYSKSKKYRETVKENKLKSFLKRSSEPTINGIPQSNQKVGDNYYTYSRKFIYK